MHHMMVGVRVDRDGVPDFFGWDEVNDLIRHGMKVVAVRPGEFYQGDLDNVGVPSLAWCSTIILDDQGIDAATTDTKKDRGCESRLEPRPDGEIPF